MHHVLNTVLELNLSAGIRRNVANKNQVEKLRVQLELRELPGSRNCLQILHDRGSISKPQELFSTTYTLTMGRSGASIN